MKFKFRDDFQQVCNLIVLIGSSVVFKLIDGRVQHGESAQKSYRGSQIALGLIECFNFTRYVGNNGFSNSTFFFDTYDRAAEALHGMGHALQFGGRVVPVFGLQAQIFLYFVIELPYSRVKLG